MRRAAIAVGALVYPVNPVRTPMPALLPIAEVTTTLTARSCVDGTCETRAAPDSNGDLSAAVGTPAFAEQSARYHAARTLTFFRELGVALPPALELFVEDPAFNARFVPEPLAIRLGKGETVNFAYDADVVAHETTHAVLAGTRASGWRLEEHGASNEPDAIDEAVADYFAAVITGDAIVGEYVGEESAVPVRSLDAKARCPDSITGHAHADSLVVSTVLWRTRAERGSAFDAQLIGALSKDSSFAELGERLGLAGALPRCVPVRDVTPEQTVSAAQIAFVAPGTARFAGLPLAPGVVQFRANVPEGAGVLSVRFGGNTFASRVVAKAGAPIRWTPSPDGTVVATEANRADVPLPSGTRVVYFSIANAGDNDGEYDFVGIAFQSERPPPVTTELAGTGSGCAAAPVRHRASGVYALAVLALVRAAVRRDSRRPPRCR